MRFLFIIYAFITGCFASHANGQQTSTSKVWVADMGNGFYQNPVINAEYSDPDVCRVGNDYYMTVSSFNSIPGLPILHSNDLVNWRIIGYALDKLIPEEHFRTPQHGAGVWAPAIRFHNGEFYIYYGDPDFGIYMTKSKNPSGPWEPLVMVKEGKGLIDPCPLFDDDGKIYLVHAYAGSRTGIKSLIAITELTPDGKRMVKESRIVYDGHDVDPTIEGPKLYKRNGFYYIFAPAGGVSTGWQVAMRAKDIMGPYERKIVMSQGDTSINGPHQGAWVDTTTSEDWFIHFRDVGTFGRVLYLEPMIWKNDWPIIGEVKKNRECGQPVLTYRKPDVGKEYPISTPLDSDEFEANRLGMQWQWNANPESWWYFANASKGYLSLYSVPLPEKASSLWDIPNLLLQKIPASGLVATMKLTFVANPNIKRERTGLVIMGLDYGLLSFEKADNGFILSQATCLKADKGGTEVVNESVILKEATVYLRVKISPEAICSFSYSKDGKKYEKLGNDFEARKGRWIGAKMGFFCSRQDKGNDGGRVDIDWFRVDK